MAKMTGLGKGLDALFGGAPLETANEVPEKIEQQAENNENLKSLKITEVEPNRDQPRKTFKQESLVFLMVGIFLLLPISVSKKNRMYKVLILLFAYLIRNKTYVYSKEIKDKGKVMNFGIKERY